MATEYIKREDALNFEMEIEADPEEIQAISKGMALYGEYIKSIPAADVVERKHGKWGNGVSENGVTTSLFCTVCHYENKHWYEWNYCPNCGADMRGEP